MQPLPHNVAGLDISDGPSGSAAGPTKLDRAAPIHMGRAVNPDSERWRGFYLRFSSPSVKPPHGAWQASCPYHKLNQSTGCKKSIMLKSVDDKLPCKLLILNWCCHATTFTRKRDHGALHLRSFEVLPMEVLEQRAAALAPPPLPGDLKDDTTLDYEASGASAQPLGPDERKKRSRPQPVDSETARDERTGKKQQPGPGMAGSSTDPAPVAIAEEQPSGASSSSSDSDSSSPSSCSSSSSS